MTLEEDVRKAWEDFDVKYGDDWGEVEIQTTNAELEKVGIRYFYVGDRETAVDCVRFIANALPKVEVFVEDDCSVWVRT